MIKINRISLEEGTSGDEDVAQNLSKALENYIRNKALGVLNQAKAEYDHFIQAVDVETTQYNDELANDYPDAIASDKSKLEAYEKQRDHVYNGPLFLNANQTWATLVNAGVDAVNLSKLTKDQDGQAILLKRVFESPDYTLAHVKRDLRLLQLCPPQYVSEVDGISEKLTNFATQANSYAENAKKATDQAREKTSALMQKKYEEFKNQVNSVLNRVNTSRQQLRAKLSENLSQSQLNSECLSLFCSQFQNFIRTDGRIYTLDIHNYLTLEADPTRMDVATPFEFEMAEIYSKLLKQQNVFLPSQFKSQALKANTTPIVVVDFPRLDHDRRAQELAYKSAYENDPVTIRNRKNTEDVTFTLSQLRAEKRDVEANPPKWETASTSHGGDRSYWTYDPNYIVRINETLSRKEAELIQKYQIYRKIEYTERLRPRPRFGIKPRPDTMMGAE